jgi:hypothetical protein
VYRCKTMKRLDETYHVTAQHTSKCVEYAHYL